MYFEYTSVPDTASHTKFSSHSMLTKGESIVLRQSIRMLLHKFLPFLHQLPSNIFGLIQGYREAIHLVEHLVFEFHGKLIESLRWTTHGRSRHRRCSPPVQLLARNGRCADDSDVRVHQK